MYESLSQYLELWIQLEIIITYEISLEWITTVENLP